VHKITLGSIERDAFHSKIEGDQISDPFGIESEHPTQMSFSRKTPSSERTEMDFEVFILANIYRVAFPCQKNVE
jgi:hypothetical protein